MAESSLRIICVIVALSALWQIVPLIAASKADEAYAEAHHTPAYRT